MADVNDNGDDPDLEIAHAIRAPDRRGARGVLQATDASACGSFKWFWFNKRLIGDPATGVGTPCHFLGGILSFIALIFVILLLSGFTHVDEFHQLLVIDRSDRWVVNGPDDVYVWWWKDTETRKVDVLKEGQYALVSNTKLGTKAIRHGPAHLFLGAYEELEAVKTGKVLTQREYLVIENTLTGTRKVVRGSAGSSATGQLYRPCESAPMDESGRTVDAEEINACPYESLGEVKSAVVLSKQQYIKVTNSLDGSVKIVRGIDGPNQDGLQYMPCMPTVDVAGNEIPIDEGDPCAYEELGDVVNARIVTEESALLVRSADTGLQRIVSTNGPYFPGPFEIIEPASRELIRVAEYETVVVAKEDGSFEFHSGVPNGSFAMSSPTSSSSSMATTSGTSFFLPPYATLLTFEWTVGYDVEEQGESGNQETTRTGQKRTVTRIDQRMQQLFFQYDDVRTNDNIEFEVEGTIFWSIEDVRQLVTSTNDPTGDLWHRMRAQVSQAASDYNYAQFLVGLKNMTSVVKDREIGNPFYTMRGLRVHDLQLIEVELKDEELESNIVDAMALEAIDRINRVEAEVSEAEVEIVRLQGVYNVDAARAENVRALEGLQAANALQAEANNQALKVAQQENQITLERARTTYLGVVKNNSMLEAQTEGVKDGVVLGSAIDEYIRAVQPSGLTAEEALRLYELRLGYQNQNTTTANLASGDAQLYLTPAEANVHLGDALQVNLPSDAPSGSGSG